MTVASTELQHHAAAWFAGWSALRSYQVTSGPGYRAALRLDRGMEWEYFSCDPSAATFTEVAAEAAATSAQHTLCIIGPNVHKYVKMAHAAGLGMVSTSEHFMVCSMENQDTQEPFLSDPEVSLVIKRLGGRHNASICQERFSATIMHGETLLASGNVGIYGDYAVFDSLQTRQPHRRAGYGLFVMRTLAARAKAHPVTTGVVLASTDGQRLYRKLGWRSLGTMTVLAPRARLAEIAQAWQRSPGP